MRDNQEYFPQLLQHVIPWASGLPNRIVIPRNNDIEITFVSPRLKYHVLYDRNLPFRVSHLNVKL